jgi:hypothetical protein
MRKIIVGVVGVLVLAVLWYALSPLLMNKKLDESLPGQETGNLAPGKKIDMALDSGATPEAIPKLFTAMPIVDTPTHPASGTVRLVQVGDQHILRYENYKTINGPDVRVYLATDINATDYVDLGPLKATEGNINYDIPAGTDLEKYHFALTWCEDFSVLFNSADLR